MPSRKSVSKSKKKPSPVNTVQKAKVNYVGIVTDNSKSMLPRRAAAVNDCNQNIETIRKAATDTGINTFVSMVQCGETVRKLYALSPIHVLQPLLFSEYPADGMTPLFDAVGMQIEIHENLPDANEPGTTFLIMATTDGEENTSKKWKHTLPAKIRELEGTDRWTFVFRVPADGRSKKMLLDLGIEEGNILEWETSARGMEVATRATVAATSDYYNSLSLGKGPPKRFFQPNLVGVSSRQVRSALVDITKEVDIWFVKDVADGDNIVDFCSRHLRNEPFRKGAAFFQLTKSEDVQGYKLLVIRDKKEKKIYSGIGDDARDLLGIPRGGEIKLRPGHHGDFDIYVQSTSYTRRLVPDTTVLYWRGAAK